MATDRSGYRVLDYGDMISREPRMSAYADALRRAVTPGCTVFDIGAGPGIFAILACQYGAGSVIAIESDDSVELLPEIARANDCADKITIFKGFSSDYNPAAKADVIISDLRGALPLYEGHIPAIVDARERLLAPGGKLIPARDMLRIAIVGAPDDCRFGEEPWLRNRLGLDLSAGHRFAANTFLKVDLKPDDLLSDAADLALLNYDQITSPDLAAEFDLDAKGTGTAHGLLLWFDAELADGIRFSNAPGEPRLMYGQTFFPFERPVDLEKGDHVTGEMSARLVDGTYVWTWQTRFDRAGSTELVEYRQSSFLSTIFVPDKLRTRAGSFTPRPRPVHEVDRFCLSLFDGERSLAAIAAEATAKFPEAFPSSSAALDHVTRLAGRYEDIGSSGGR